MSHYQFTGSLYRTQSDMLDAIAHDWVTSGGKATLNEVHYILLSFSDDALAVDCVTEWALDEPPDPDDPDSKSHMARHGYDASDLEHAFSRFREDIEHDLDVEARGGWESYEP